MGKTIQVEAARTPWGWGGAIEDRYRPMIARLEAFSRERPGAYRRRVFGGALLGYAYLSLIFSVMAVATCVLIIVTLTPALAFVAGHLVVTFFLSGVYLLRALWVKFEAPKGKALKRKDAPALFAALKSLRRQTRGPRVSKVFITDEFNAAIVQVPRLGIFGWHRNYLLLGLPLLLALSEDEVKAVVAHEYGHLAGAHGKLSAWVYRVRQTWARLSYAFDTGGMAFLLRGFFRWYGPWFNAYSFVLARSNEYEADRCSAAATSSRTAALALTRISAEDHRFSVHWDRLRDHNREAETPSVLPYAALRLCFAEPFAEADRARVLSGALKEVTDIHNTHPCLSDRLTALGEALPDLPPVERSGALSLLGEGLTYRLTERFDTDWWQQASPMWQENFRRAEAMRTRRRELDDLAQQGPLEKELYWERINLIEYEGDAATALVLAEAWARAHPDDLDVRRRVAQLRLKQGDATGVAHMQAVLDGGDRSQRFMALGALAAYYASLDPDHPRLADVSGQMVEIERFDAYVDDYFSRLSPKARMETPDLPDAVITALKRALAMNSRVKHLWVGRRSVPEDRSIVQYVALYICRTGTEAVAKERFMDDVLRLLQPLGAVMVVENNRQRNWLRQRLRKMSGTQVRRDRVKTR